MVLLHGSSLLQYDCGIQMNRIMLRDWFCETRFYELTEEHVYSVYFLFIWWGGTKRFTKNEKKRVEFKLKN